MAPTNTEYIHSVIFVIHCFGTSGAVMHLIHACHYSDHATSHMTLYLLKYGNG